MDEPIAVKDLINDLQWQLDQIPTRGVKNDAGGAYNPAHYRRKLAGAIDDGDEALVEFVRGHLYKPPNVGYKKLEAAGSLDLSCEALVADSSKPYAGLFTDADREAAAERLAPHRESIETHNARRRTQIEAARASIRAKGVPRRLDLDFALRTRRRV